MGPDVASPFFSVVTPVYNPGLDVLRMAVESVQEQTFADWELVLVDDRSPDEGVRELLRSMAADDPRIRLVERAENGGICLASNDGVTAARGGFIALLDHDDLLVPHALERMHDEIRLHPDVDYLYSDEDKVDDRGTFFSLFEKPPWSPERLRAQMYTCHLSVLRTELVREVGGFREGYDGSQDHDLVLRLTEKARRIVHVPEVLYHWRTGATSTASDPGVKPYAVDARLRAVQDHLDRTGVDATAYLHPETNAVLLRRRLAPEQLVSVIVPTRGSGRRVWGEHRVLVVEAVRSLLERGGHDNLEVVLVHDTETPAGVLTELRDLLGARLVLVPYEAQFNFSEKCNLGMLAASGDLLLFLNDDIEISSDNFVPDLIAPLLEPGVGLTGANLRFANTTTQHGGLGFKKRWPVHAFYRLRAEDPGHFGAMAINREVAGVTGACIGVRRDTYEDVGGMTEILPINFNDVDFCLKVAHRGQRILWISTAQAYHFESQTREAKVHAWETERLARRWHMPEVDPYLPHIL